MTVQFDSNTPIYLQIADMIRQSILAGEIKEGESIPSVRQISVEQNLNPQTVLNATQLLINDGLIEKRRGLGMFVTQGAYNKLMQIECDKFRQEEIPATVNRAKLLDISEEELVKIVKKSYEEEE